MGHMIVSFEAEIDRAASHSRYVAANVVTEQVMREEEITRLPHNLGWLRQRDVRVPTRGHEPVGTLFPEEGCMGQVRPRPHPKIAHVRAWLVCYQYSGEQSERARASIGFGNGHAVQMVPTRAMWVGRNVQRDLCLPRDGQSSGAYERLRERKGRTPQQQWQKGLSIGHAWKVDLWEGNCDSRQ